MTVQTLNYKCSCTKRQTLMEMRDTDMQSLRQVHAHINAKSQFKELQLHLRYVSGQHHYDVEGELLTVLLGERHQTVA